MKKLLLSGLFSACVYDTPITQNVLWETQKKVILKPAQKGPCVIVDRCADYIPKDTADCLRVFIHADHQTRAKRIVDVYGETDDAPLKRIDDKDRRRSEYYHQYTGAARDLAENYHVLLDSGVFGLDACVDLLTSLY